MDFNGIVCGAPVVSMTGEMITLIHYAQYFFPRPGRYDELALTKDDLTRLHQEVIAQCDGQDGVKDGVLDDPRECHFDVSKVAWLSPKQRKLVEAAYDGPRAQGASIHPGLPLGSEAEWYEWFAGCSLRLLESNNAPNMSHLMGTQFCKYFIFCDASWDYSTYDLAHWAHDGRVVASFLNPVDTDLSAFQAAGGKLILWHGWSDAMATPLSTVAYFEEVEQRDSQVRDYIRLFMLPGVGHCGGGIGPDHVDWMKRIVEWVENGKAPYRVVARKLGESGEVTMSRPIYPYPLRAVQRQR